MRIVTQDDDAPGFVAEVRACVSGIVRKYQPAELFLIKTDTWFGPHWVRFRGKVLGLVGRWGGPKIQKLTVPPFVPHRILWERRYVAPDYKQIPIRTIIHAKVPADTARTRYMHEVAPGASVVWYSGSSRLNKRAAILAYLLVEGSYWPWYLGWEMQGEWKIVNVGNVSLEEIAEIRKSDAPLDSSESEAAIR